MMLPHIAARIFNEPLLYDARKVAAMLEGLGGRITGHNLTLEGVEPI